MTNPYKNSVLRKWIGGLNVCRTVCLFGLSVFLQTGICDSRPLQDYILTQDSAKEFADLYEKSSWLPKGKSLEILHDTLNNKEYGREANKKKQFETNRIDRPKLESTLFRSKIVVCLHQYDLKTRAFVVYPFDEVNDYELWPFEDYKNKLSLQLVSTPPIPSFGIRVNSESAENLTKLLVSKGFNRGYRYRREDPSEMVLFVNGTLICKIRGTGRHGKLVVKPIILRIDLPGVSPVYVVKIKKKP